MSTRKLGRVTAHRNAMLRGMVTLLLDNGKIETTVTRAKEVQSIAEQIITTAKKSYTYREDGDKVNAYNERKKLYAYITKQDVVEKVVAEIAPKYLERNGGYTQIFKIGPRRGDAAEMAVITLVESK
ncbi:MAG: 50S ribosomal protein L17 [Clostridia bacterium]|nr:50S ribosomal protein L17 [Clostridia bacterium]MBQ7727937.1 50S ribosomal protein L17 [Clostridia bacterium]